MKPKKVLRDLYLAQSEKNGFEVTVKDHYDNLLAQYYSWMFGDYQAMVNKNKDFFRAHNIVPLKSSRAIDLGCGSGFQSLALADLGFSVLSFDLSAALLEELELHCGSRDIKTVQSDIISFQDYVSDQIEVIACMGDTLTHLESLSKIGNLFREVYKSLEPGGKFCLSFRDMTEELKGVERIIPVRADENILMTCFLEYKDMYVNVHDVIYNRTQAGWEINKSSYRKIRVGVDWVKQELEEAGFKILFQECINGYVFIIALKAL